jgi:hypothetical protein
VVSSSKKTIFKISNVKNQLTTRICLYKVGIVACIVFMAGTISTNSFGQSSLQQRQVGDQIFTEVSERESSRLEKQYPITKEVETTLMRRRFVRLDTSLMTKLVIVPNMREAKLQEIEIMLFKDASAVISTEKVEPVSKNRYNWIGHVDGNESDRAILIYKDNRITGNIRFKNRLFQIRPVDGNIHSVSEIDTGKFPNELDPDDHDDTENPYPVDSKIIEESTLVKDNERAVVDKNDSISAIIAGEVLQATVERYSIAEISENYHVSHGYWYRDFFHTCGPFIDVLVIYTNDAEAASADIDAEIALAITETNDSYSNSGINQRLRLVHTEEVDYTETGDLFKDRNRLRGTSDGYIDNVHSLRNKYSADLVSLWVETADYCGVGDIMKEVNTSFASKGFCVVKRSCATGNYSFGHELGHIMSARHDWYADDTDGSPYTYNHGYYNLPDLWRTIMAYNEGCDCSNEDSPCPDMDSRDTPWSPECVRIAYWSNPDKTYGGDPMGVPVGQANAADNRRTLNNTSSTVASFRTTVRKQGGAGWGSNYYATHIAFGDVDNDGRDEVGITRYARSNARWWILDDAITGFRTLKSGGSNWGSDYYATSIEFGNVDNDPALEVGLTRKAGSNARWWIFDDASTGFRQLKEGGANWGESNYATDIAFGDVDNDGRDEIGLTRKAGGNARWWILDDAIANFAALISGGSNWGSGNYATGIAFGNVDDDDYEEVGLVRKTSVNARWWILDDAHTNFSALKSGGQGWGSNYYATDIAFGDVDDDGRDEIGLTRMANVNARWWILDDAGANFGSLRSGGQNWGSGGFATSIAFGDVDNDGYDEVTFCRKANINNRFWVLDDAKCSFRTIQVGGFPWGSGNYGKSVAMGDVDGTGTAEIGIARKAGVNSRYWVFDLDY